MADTDWSKFSPASPPSGETDWSNFTPDEVKQKDQDSALVRGTKNAWNSIKTGGALLTGDADLAAQLAAERDAYRRANPGTKEGNELMKAWESGDGISGGISNVAGEMAKDWREAPGVMAGIRETGKNLSAMGGGIVEQIPNMVAPMGGMLAGGAAGSMAGPAGAIGGAWAGATAGNTLVESGEQVDRALMTAGINPQDKEAVRDFLAKNGDTILGQAGTKGAIIGAVDTATLGLGSKLLRAPTKAAIERAIASGINPTDNLAIQAAVKADPIYLATQKGASALGRNAVVAGLEPAGEFTGEYLGQGVATGDWDTKGAALEALSSLGQSGITFAGQKIYDAATSPLRKSAPGEQAPTVATPEDTAQMNALNAELGATQFNNETLIPSEQLALPPGVITVPNNAGGETVVDSNNGPISSAAVTAVTNSTLAEDVASGMPLKGYSPEQAKEELASRPDADRYEIKPHPVSGDRGRVAIVPKSAQALAEIDAKASAGNEAMARNEQLAAEEDSRKQSIQTAKDVQSLQKQVIDMHRSAAAIEKSITPNTSPQDIAIAREQAADLRSQAKTLNEQIKEIANAPQMATTSDQGSGGIAGGSTGNTQAVGGIDGGRGGSAGSSVSGRGADLSMGDAGVSDAALDELSPSPVQPMSEMPAMQAIAQQRAQQATQQADVRAQQLAQEEGMVAEPVSPTVKVPRPMKVGGLRAAKYSDEQLQAVVDNANVPATSRRAAAAEIAWRQAESEAAAQTEIAQSTGKMSLPRDDSWIADLFSQSTTPEAAAVDAENNAKSAQAKIERSDAAIAMLTGEIHANTAEAAELAARKYKQNRKQVELKGDGPLRNPSMSVSQINENRRRRAIEAKSKSSSAMAKAIDSIASDADGFFGQVADMVDRVTQQFNEGFFGPNAVLDDQLDMAVGSLVGASQASGEKSAGRQIRMAAVAYKEGEAPAGKLSRQRAGESQNDYQYRMAAEKNQAKAQRQQQPQTASEAEDIAAVRRAIKDPKAEVSVVAEESMPDMDKAASRQVSKQSATFLRHVAKTFGKEIVFVDGMESDGFYQSGNKIYLSNKSSVHHVRVLGHEMLHAMKRQNRASYDKLLKAVSEIATDTQLTGQFKDYFAMDAKMNTKTDAEIAEWIADPANREMILEEMMADLSGNRWAESSFWESVFTKIDAKYGSEQAKGIIAKLRLALVNALNKLMSLVKGGQFKVDARVAEHLESIREALATGFADYAKAVKDNQVSEDGVGEVKFSGKQTNIDKLKKLMTDREKSKVGKHNADRIVELFNVMPSEKEMAAVAYAGKAKRGWYKNSANALTHLFGSEARRFAGLLAALSPRVSVEVNTRNSLRMWANWDSSGRPTDKPSIMRLLGQSVEGSGTEASVMGAWVNNSMEALTTNNLDNLTLSGPKVNSFMLNLVGNWDEVTNDAWVANYALVDQKLFSGTGKSKDGSDPGKGVGYLAMNVKTRMAAKILSKETGVTWTPAEVQETIWSWAKTMLETLDAYGETRTAKQLMNDGVITDDLIVATPDFELLFRQEPYAGILRNAGMGSKLNSMPMPKHEDPGRAPFADEKRQSLLDEAARRIEFLQRQRRTNMQISWEAKPGGTTGILPGIFGAPLHVQQQYLADIFAEFDMLQVGKKLGIDMRRTLFGPSAWKGDVAAGAQTILQKIGIVADNMGSVKVDADSRKNLEVAASVLGYVLNQEGVYWHYPIYRTPDNHAMYPTGVEVNFGRSLTTAEVAEFYGIVSKLAGHQDWAPANTPMGVRFLNFTSFNDNPEQQFDHKKFEKIIERAAGRLKPWANGATMRSFTFDGDAIENNWKESPNGEDYKSRVGKAGRSDLLKWADDQLSPAIDRVNKRYADQYGWGPASRLERDAAATGATPDNFSAKFSPARYERPAANGGVAGQGRPGDRQLGRVDVTGTHYSREQRKHLTGGYFGTGLAGEEGKRLKEAKDTRLHSRLYAYVNEGQGVFPEAGVGAYAHTVKLDNLYDIKADPLGIRQKTRDANDRESLILDAGFDGYYAPQVFGRQGVAILMGGAATRGVTPTDTVAPAVNVETAPKTERRTDLPMGKMTGAEWKKLEPRATDLEDGKMYYRDEIKYSPPRWYFSPLEKAFESAPDKVFGQAAQVKLWLAGNKSKLGLKDDEIFWTGINDWLDMQGKQRVSKADVLGYLGGSGVQVQEVMKGVPGYDENDPRLPVGSGMRVIEATDGVEGYEVLAKNGRVIGTGKTEADAISDAYSGNPEYWEGAEATKFGQYTLPGGESYRELLLTLPDGRRLPDGFDIIANESTAKSAKKFIVQGPDGHRYASGDTKEEATTNYLQYHNSADSFKSSHWDERNILAHIRMNDRTDADGNKVLFIEEVQSDWGQEGKKNGFNRNIDRFVAYYNAPNGTEVAVGYGDTMELALERAGDWVNMPGVEIKVANRPEPVDTGTPPAPFITDTKAWLSLAIKRITAYAAENGYDKVAFINGEQSADRYDLSKQVDAITYDPDNNRLVAAKNGQRVIDQANVKPENLEDYIGKEAAKKLMDSGKNGSGNYRLTGESLKVGGTGMKTFYDRIVPQVLSDVLKKVGGKMDSIKVSTIGTAGKTNVFEVDDGLWGNNQTDYVYRSKEEAEEAATGRTKQTGFTVTPKMSEPLPLFSPRRQTETPEFKKWFGSGAPLSNRSSLVLARQSAMSKRGPDGNASNSKSLSDLFVSKTFSLEGLGGFDVPTQREMLNGVFSLGDDLEVVRSVVKLIPVDVMNILKRENLSAESLFSNKPMLKKLLSSDSNGSVAAAVDVADALVLGVARVAAKRSSVSADPFTGPEEGNSAAGTGGFDKFHVGSIDQINTIGNNGQFDPANPDIRRSTTRSAATGQPIIASWASPEISSFDNIVRQLQDKLIDTKRVVDAIRGAGKAISDVIDPYLQEILYHGRAAKKTQDFAEQELRPMLQAMQMRKVTMQEIEDYLWAQHAPERNAQNAKAGIQDGSGLTDGEARDILAGRAVTKNGRTIQLNAAKMQDYRDMSAKVKAINDKTLDELVAYGLETRATVDQWKRTYQNYVPLMRDMSDDNYAGANNRGLGTGKGFSVRGSASKRAIGSQRGVIDIMANIAMQRERAITRGEKNKVSQATYGLALAAPNPDFWLPIDPAANRNPAAIAKLQKDLISLGMNPIDAQNVAQEPVQTYIDPRTGQASHRINPALRNRNDVLAVRINGEDKFLMFSSNDRAQAMVTNLKNLDDDQLGGFLQASAKITRWFASVNTQYNPVFGMVNGIRDFGGAMLNLTSTPLAGQQAQVAKYGWDALRGIYSDLRDHRAGRNPSSAWAQEFEEFASNGGQTGYRDMFNTADDRTKALQKELERMASGDVKKWTSIGENHPVFAWLSDYNTAIENAFRLAAYKVAKENGMTQARAAQLAKNLTVNFNKKGLAATQTGALYAFFNAAVQGTARIGETLLQHNGNPSDYKNIRLSKMGKQIVLGGITLGVMQALLGAMAGWDDDEPKQFQRERNLIIPIPGSDKYISIPLPLGFHVLPNLGRITTEFMLSGFKNPGKRLTDLLGVMAEAFNPIGNAGMSLQTIAPTFADPLVALATNKDWNGQSIAREDFNMNKPTPGWSRTKDNASPWGKTLAYALNYVSGGGEYGKGMISPTPDQLDYLVGQVTGGVGREISKLATSAKTVTSGEELPMYKVPIAGRFVGETTGVGPESGRFYDNLEKIGAHDFPLKKMKEERDLAGLRDYLNENPEAKLIKMADKAQRDISDLRMRKRKTDDPDRVKSIESMISLRMKSFNNQVRNLQERSG